jgi:hypothetical protein
MKNSKILKITLFTLAIVLLFELYENLLNKPFPFVSMKYVSYEEFNSEPQLLDFNITLDINRSKIEKLKSFVSLFKKTAFGDLDDDIQATTMATREIMHESNGESIREIDEVISHNQRYKRICSESSKIFATLMQSIGYPSRVIWMSRHTVSEIYTEKYGWILVDTYGNIVFKDKQGRYKSLLDINTNFHKLKPFNIVKKRYRENIDYIENGYINRETNVYKNENLFVVIDGKSLGTFHKKTRDISAIIDFAIFNKPFAYGIQYIKENSKKVGNIGVSFYKRF